MFEFLKKVWRQEVEIVVFSKLQSWLDAKFVGLSPEDYVGQLRSGIAVVQENLNALEAASIGKEYKVEDRVRNIVFGHRQQYVAALRRCVDAIEMPATVQESIEFTALLLESLDAVAANTSKSYSATQHLFFEQVKKVFSAMQKIHITATQWNKKLEKLGLIAVEDIHTQIVNLDMAIQQKIDLDKELLHAKTLAQEFEESVQQAIENFEKKKQGDDCTTYLQLEAQREDANAMVKRSTDAIHVFFAPVQRPLRKYEKVTLQSQLVKAYLRDPVDALLHDTEYSVLSLLKALAQNNEISLDEKEREKVFHAIEHEQLSSMVNVLQQAIMTLKKAEEQLLASSYPDDLKTMRRSVEDAKARQTKQRFVIEKLKDVLQGIDLQGMKQDIIQNVETTYGVKVE